MDQVVMRAVLTADYSELERGVGKSIVLLEDLAKFDLPTVRPKFDHAFADNLKKEFAELRKLSEKALNVKVRLDIEGGNARDLQRQLASLDKLGSETRKFKVEASADTGPATASLKELMGLVDQVKANKKLTITVAGGASGGGTSRTGEEAKALRDQKALGASWAREIEAEWKRAGISMNRFGDITQTASGRMRELGKTSRETSSWTAGLGKSIIGTATGMLVFQGLAAAQNVFVGAIKSGIGYLSDEQRILTGLTTQLDGNSAAARQLYKDLQALNDRSPLREQDILPNAQKMLAAKMPVPDVKNAMQGVSDQNSAVSGDAQKFGQISTALNQIFLKPHLQLEELTTQLIEHGVPAFDMLARAYGTNVTQIQKWISQGIIPGREAFRALVNQMQRDNFGASERQARTAAGAYSTLSDRLKRGLGGAFRDTFEQGTYFLNMLVSISGNKQFGTWLTGQGAAVRTVFGGIFGFLSRTGSFVAGAAKSFYDHLGPLRPWAARWAVGMGLALIGINPAIGTLVAGATFLYVAYKQNLLGLKTATDTVVSWIIDRYKDLTVGIASVYDFFSNLTGGEGGYVRDTIRDWQNIDAQAAKFRENLTQPLDFGKVLEDARKYASGLSGIVSKAPAPYVPKLGEPANADDKAKAAALKLRKDQLGDTASAEEKYAAAVEKSAEKQISKIEELRESYRDFFGMMQERFIALGVIDDPMGKALSGFEKLLDLSKRAQGIASPAVTLRDSLLESARANRSQLETLEGKDGVVPSKGGNVPVATGSDTGARIAAEAEAMQKRWGDRIGSVFYRQCDRLTDTTVNSATKAFAGIMGPMGRGDSAAKTMARFQRAGVGFAATPGMAYAPGDIVYSGATKKNSAGHVQIVDTKGRFSDQYGSHPTPTTRPHWVVRAGGSAPASDAALAKPSLALGGLKSQVESAKKLLNIDPSKMDGKKLDEVLSQGFDGAVSKFKAVPKVWGAAVRDTESTSARFALQTKLATSEFQKDLEFTAALTGKTVPQIVQWLRKLANAADFKLNAIGLSRDFEKMATATRTGRSEASQRIGALRDAAPLLQSPNFSSAAYERSLGASQLRRQAWAAEDVQKQYAAMKAMERGGNHKGAHALSSRLNTQVTERINTAQMSDDAARLQASQAAYAALMRTQRDELGLLQFENGLLAQNGKSREQIERAMAVETARRKALADLKAGKPTASPAEVKGFETQSKATGEIAGQNFDAGKLGSRVKETKDFNSQTERSIALLKAQGHAYLTLSSGSPALALELKRLEIRNSLVSKYAGEMKGGRVESLSPPRLKNFNRELGNQMSIAKQEQLTQAAQLYGDTIGGLNREMAGLGDSTGLAAAQYERMNGLFSLVSPAERATLAIAQLDAATKRLRASVGMDILSKQGQFEEGLATTARARLESSNRTRDALEGQRVTMGGAPLPQAYYDAQGATDKTRLQGADEEDRKARIVEHLNRQKELELAMVTTSAQKLAIEHRYEDLIRARLGIKQSPEARVSETANRSSELQDARMQDTMAYARSQAELMRSMFHDSMKDGLSGGIVAGFKGFAKRVQDTWMEAEMNKLSRKAAGLPSDPTASIGVDLLGIISGRNRRENPTPGMETPEGPLTRSGLPAQGPPIFTPPFNPIAAAVQAPTNISRPSVAQSSAGMIAQLGGVIMGGKGGNDGKRFSSATFHIQQATQHIARATQNNRNSGGAGGTDGGSGTSPGVDQVMGVLGMFT